MPSEEPAFLLFLKMDRERSDLLGESSIIPAKWRWDKLAPLAGDNLQLQYRHVPAHGHPESHGCRLRGQAGRQDS
jgi:hypothetical protein